MFRMHGTGQLALTVGAASWKLGPDFGDMGSL
jgi:hypothetical protein